MENLKEQKEQKPEQKSVKETQNKTVWVDELNKVWENESKNNRDNRNRLL
jgi:hypothetical protein